MFEQAPKNNQEETLLYENEDMLNNPDYIKEMIEYIQGKIRIEHSLGHSTETLQSEKEDYNQRLKSLENPSSNYKDVA